MSFQFFVKNIKISKQILTKRKKNSIIEQKFETKIEKNGVKFMKTNLSSLMNVVAEEERKFSEYGCNVNEYAYNTSIQELDGKVNVIEDYTEDFKKTFEEYKNTQIKITKIKSIIYEKNNTFKLPDGRTIQEAIVDNTNLRKMKSLYSSLLNKRNSKRRVTEVNNSYFECKTLNYDIEKIKNENELIEKKIQDTDFEISKLNSIEFEVNI